MAIQATEKIWHNGKLIPWNDAKIHIMSHVVNYGSSVFEGIRCYAPGGTPAIFRLQEHLQRLTDSAKIYRMEAGFTHDQLREGALSLIAANGIWPCYMRPVIMRGYGEAGVNPFNSPIDVYMVNYPWGKYLGHGSPTEGVEACVSSWSRIAPNTMPAMSKAGANYMNSQLIKMEAVINGYVEGIALDTHGYVSEASGANIFLVRGGKLITPPLGNSILPGITRDAVLKLAEDIGVPVVEQVVPREMLYIADEVFFCGTASEITPIGSVDKIKIGNGSAGPVTMALQHEFFGIVNGTMPDRHDWFTKVPVRAQVKQAVGA
ncbi:MAG TPA: branched-chain amino acid transaminase [Candidatus Saccharimonadales bacterium]|jgi:branched-chain amino acid aminotransferase|nr:branched-chain amino acid transaminase [Candidatus Saccharimonadales bacterium]